MENKNNNKELNQEEKTYLSLWQQIDETARKTKQDFYDVFRLSLTGRSRAEIKKFEEILLKNLNPEDQEKTKKLFKRYLWEDPNNGIMPFGADYLTKYWKPKIEKIDDGEGCFLTDLFPTMQNGKVQPTQFTPGTLNLIGGMPGAGKTGALISLAMEAIEKRRKVLYVTCDEPLETLMIRMQLSLLARNFYKCGKENNPLNLGNDKDGDVARLLNNPGYIEKPFMFKYLAMALSECQINKQNALLPSAERAIIRAREYGFNALNEIMQAGWLKVFDTRPLQEKGFDWQDFCEVVQDLDENSIVMIDYVQAFDILPQGRNKEFLDQQRTVVSSLTDLARKTGHIFICAAQLTRDREKDERLSTLTLSSIADSSEPGKRASLVIGINKVLETAESSRYYYRVIKDRLNEVKGQYWLDKTGYPYSFVHPELDAYGRLVGTPSESEWQIQKKDAQKQTKEKAEKEFNDSFLPGDDETDGDQSEPGFL